MIKQIFRRIFSGLMLISCISTTITAQTNQTIEVSAGVFEKNSRRFVSNLTNADFELTENNRPRKIVAVEADSRSLSIVVVPTLGEGKTCGRAILFYPSFFTLSNDMSVFGGAIARNVKENDELAVITTDADVTQIRGFDSINSVGYSFGRVSDLSKKLQVTISTTETKYTEHGTETTETKAYLGVEVNAVKEALFKAFDYLKANKKAGNRSVVLLARTLYNTSNLTDADELEIKTRLLRENITLNWIGDNTETIFMKLFPEKDYYRDLPKFSGGIKEPCSVLKAKKQSVLEAAVTNIFSQMRDRYRIMYQTDVPPTDNQMRPLSVKLSGAGRRKANGAVVVNAPQFAVAPQ